MHGNRFSEIALRRRFELPARAFCRPSDRLVGLAMLWDGMVAFATQQGVVGVVPRRPAEIGASTVRTLSLNGRDCSDSAVADEELEGISNSIAADERGGIYPVTSRAQYKLRWTGRNLERAWRAEYARGGGEGGARVGSGSGSTPTLMGTGPRQDKFVVITDGQELVHLVLLWRGRVPRDWEPIAPGKDRRQPAEHVHLPEPVLRERVAGAEAHGLARGRHRGAGALDLPLDPRAPGVHAQGLCAGRARRAADRRRDPGDVAGRRPAHSRGSQALRSL